MTTRILRGTLLILSLVGFTFLLAGPSKSRSNLRNIVSSSDLIVVGSFSLGTVDSTEAVPLIRGTLTVEEVLWGDLLSFLTGEVVGIEEVLVEWWASPEQAPVNTMAEAEPKGLWLLQKTFSGVYRAGKGRYIDLSHKRRVARYLRRDMVILRRALLQPASSRMVDLVLRNAQKKDALVPEFRYKNGILYLHPGVYFEILAAPPEPRSKSVLLAHRPGRIQVLDEEDWIMVSSGEEQVVRFSLNEIYQLPPQKRLDVRFQIKGYGQSSLTFP